MNYVGLVDIYVDRWTLGQITSSVCTVFFSCFSSSNRANFSGFLVSISVLQLLVVITIRSFDKEQVNVVRGRDKWIVRKTCNFFQDPNNQICNLCLPMQTVISCSIKHYNDCFLHLSTQLYITEIQMTYRVVLSRDSNITILSIFDIFH